MKNLIDTLIVACLLISFFIVPQVSFAISYVGSRVYAYDTSDTIDDSLYSKWYQATGGGWILLGANPYPDKFFISLDPTEVVTRVEYSGVHAFYVYWRNIGFDETDNVKIGISVSECAGGCNSTSNDFYYDGTVSLEDAGPFTGSLASFSEMTSGARYDWGVKNIAEDVSPDNYYNLGYISTIDESIWDDP